jgi:hypothetical protein
MTVSQGSPNGGLGTGRRERDRTAGEAAPPPARRAGGSLISAELARRLRDAGLDWQPADGDRFVIPDRLLDDQVFAISEMSVDVLTVLGERLIAFNGAVEWALDSIVQREVIWLPSETQLRELLGAQFVSLQRVDDRYRCEVTLAGERVGYEHVDAIECYGLALLDRLERDRRR